MWNQGAGRDVEQPFRFLISTPRPVAEPNHPLGVVQLEGCPSLIELVIGKADPTVRKVANHRRRERAVGLAATVRTENQLVGAGYRGGLFGENGRGEALNPLDVHAGFRGYLRDRPAAAKSLLHLTRTQGAVYSRSRRRRRRRRRDGLVSQIRCTGPIDLFEQIVVELYDEVAGLCTPAAREYQPIVVRGESDEMKLSHRRPRRAEPAVRALLAQSSSLCPLLWGIPGLQMARLWPVFNPWQTCA